MNNQRKEYLRSRIAGFSVIVHQGKEITQAQVDKEHLQQEVTTKVNGPHHDANWAQDVKTHTAQELHKKVFFGMPTRLNKTNGVWAKLCAS